MTCDVQFWQPIVGILSVFVGIPFGVALVALFFLWASKRIG